MQLISRSELCRSLPLPTLLQIARIRLKSDFPGMHKAVGKRTWMRERLLGRGMGEGCSIRGSPTLCCGLRNKQKRSAQFAVSRRGDEIFATEDSLDTAIVIYSRS